ncbi:MAG: ParB/RepB/Spo0J family partition protein [Oscillospiraceae bacterium]|nr:ParB/RepB/Spo0J family partition protein [Oscillospiraceae bacterium]
MAIFTKKMDVNVINKVVELMVDEISPNPAQPRVIFDDHELAQLAISIGQNGILQPLTVRKAGELSSGYELIAGERRLRAAKMTGLKSVPCIVMEADSSSSAILAIMENIQRSDLNYIEEAFAIKRLIEFLGITQEEVAIKLGLAQSTVANKLRLLKLSDAEKALVLRYKLNERQARALLKLPEELRITAIQKIAHEQLNTADADKLVKELLSKELGDSGNSGENKRSSKSFLIKHAEVYINTFDHTIDTMKKAGIDCEAIQRKTSEYVEYSIKIPIK